MPNKIPPQERLAVDASDAAALLGITSQALNKAIQSGIIPKPVNICGKKVFPVKLLEKALYSDVSSSQKSTAELALEALKNNG